MAEARWKQYSEAFQQYLGTKMNHEISFKESLANRISAKGVDPTMTIENTPGPVKLQGYTQEFATVEAATAALYEDMNSVGDLIDRVVALNDVVNQLAEKLGSENGPAKAGFITQVNNLYSRIQYLAAQVPRGASKFNIQFPGGEHIYTNLGDLQKMYSRTLKASLALMAEQLAGHALQTAQGEDIIANQVEKMIPDTLRSFQTGSADLQASIKAFVEQEKVGGNSRASVAHWNRQFGSNLVDISLSEKGGQVTFNISQKQYRPQSGALSEFKGLSTTVQRILLYLNSKGIIDVAGYWGLIRAMASPKSPSGALLKAFKRDTWLPAIFGEGADQVTDFLINGVLIPASQVYDELTKHTDQIKLTIGPYAGGEDPHASKRTSEVKSTHYFLQYVAAKNVANRSFKVEFAIPTSWYNF